MLQALIDKSQENVTGTVRLKLYKGNTTVVGRKSPQVALLDEARDLRGRRRAPTTSATPRASSS